MRCGNCGADVTFSSPGTLIVVCTHCSWSSRRTDIDLRTIGKVAQPALIASQLQIGTSGRLGENAFTVRGQLQLDHGAGLWNEWAAEDDEGSWLWIAEAQGQLLVFREVEDPGLESVEDQQQLSPGKQAKFAGERWLVNEVGNGLVVAAAGEHPIAIEVGIQTSYVDLQSGERKVATLDYTRGGVPECLVGERVELEDLHLDPLTQPEHRPEQVPSRRIDCANCGGGIDLLDPEHAVRVGCPSCGTLLEPTSAGSRAIEQAKQIKDRPDLPLGARGSLRGEDVQVLGCMERRVHADGRWWPWREYLLRTPRGAYRWLVEDNGHWLHVTPIPYAAVSAGTYRGQKFKHFTSGDAEVHWVQGEFYWQVQAGEKTKNRDYTCPPHTLSIESTPLEIQASLGVSLSQAELRAGFPEHDLKLPRQSGVGLAVVNTQRPSVDWKIYVALVVLLVVLKVVLSAGAENRVVFEGTFGPTPATVSQISDGDFSDEFKLTADPGNLKVELAAPGIQQGWIGLYGSLINVDTGDVTNFDTSAQQYSGVDGGERWSEGNSKGSTTLGSVPAGTYRMRLAAEGYDAGLNHMYSVKVRSQVPTMLWFLLALVLPLPFAIIASLRWYAFEHKRWSNSDNPWGEE
ncbi:MAG: DUF4178 domain-containing protein [Planctomycetota bacterium]|nr:DUF4178 domain-containing protein [Planctomycetota bacterium]